MDYITPKEAMMLNKTQSSFILFLASNFPAKIPVKDLTKSFLQKYLMVERS